MSPRNALWIVLAVITAVTSQCMCFAADNITALRGYDVVAENEHLVLYLNFGDTKFAVLDRSSGTMWFSNPPDGRGMDEQLTISYYTPNDQKLEMSNFKDSVELGQFEIKEIEDGVRIEYTLGSEYPKLALLPRLLRKDRLDGIMRSLEDRRQERDLERILEFYTLIALEPLDDGDERVKLVSMDVEDVFGDYKLISPGEELDSSDTRKLMQNLATTISANRLDIENWSQLQHEDVEYLIDHPTYMLNERVPGFMLESIQETLVDCGFTMDDMAEAAVECSLDPPIGNLTSFTVALEYVLDGRDLIVRVPIDSIRYPKGAVDQRGEYGLRDKQVTLPLHSIRLLEYFGAAERGEDGYIFVPDGSGALVRLDNEAVAREPYVGRVYGTDSSLAASSECMNSPQQVFMPVYGLKSGQSAFFAVIESGAAFSRIRATASQASNRYYYMVSPEFTVIPRGTTTLAVDVKTGELQGRYTVSKNAMSVFQSRTCQEDVQVRYAFLGGREADYVGMAQWYQTYLAERGILTPLNSDAVDAPMFVELVGGFTHSKPVLGLHREVMEPLTTYDQAIEILTALVERGVSNIKLRYDGWMDGGIRHCYPERIRLSRVLGGERGFERLVNFAKSNGIDLYPNISLLNVYESGLFDGFQRLRDGARAIDGRVAERPFYNPATFQASREKPPVVLSPANLGLLVDAVMTEYRMYSLDHISLAYAGTQVNSDFRDDETSLVDRGQSVDAITTQLRKMKDAGFGIMLEGANSYALGYADCVVNMPITGSNLFVTDDYVPFMQIVVHGFLDYAGPPLNQTHDPVTHFLRTIEVGGSLYYRWCFDDPYRVKNTDFNYLFSVHYEDYVEQAVFLHNRANSLLGSVRAKRIVDHEEIADSVYQTTFDGGYVVIVNYNDEPVSIGDITIGAKDYTSVVKEDTHAKGY